MTHGNHEAIAGKTCVTPKPTRARSVEPFETVYNGHYDLTEFIAIYKLQPLEAREILERIGPSRTKLDAYMNELRVQAQK